jgi:hypothetical protein
VKVNTNVNYDRPGDGQYAADAYTKLLIHSDTSNNSTTFDDSSDSGQTVTANGNAQHKTAQKKIGASSIYFDGDTDYLEISDSLGDFAFGTGAFTIEFWCYQPSILGGAFVTADDLSGSNRWAVYDYNGHASRWLAWWPGDPETYMHTGTEERSDATWHHIAVVRENNSAGGVKIYVDGVSQAWNQDDGDVTDYGAPTTVKVATYGGTDEFEGYMDEVRVSSTARWTSNFPVY